MCDNLKNFINTSFRINEFPISNVAFLDMQKLHFSLVELVNDSLNEEVKRKTDCHEHYDYVSPELNQSKSEGNLLNDEECFQGKQNRCYNG
jgi:hypothetical protein